MCSGELIPRAAAQLCPALRAAIPSHPGKATPPLLQVPHIYQDIQSAGTDVKKKPQ